MRPWQVVFVTVALLLFPVLVSAGGTEPLALDPLRQALAEAAGQIVAMLAILLVAWIVRQAREHGLISAKQVKDLRDEARKMAPDIALWVEARAEAQLKTDKGKMTPEEKIALGVGEMLERLPGIKGEEGRVIVEAALPRVGLGAAYLVEKVSSAAKF